MGYSPWDHKELDTTEQLTLLLSILYIYVCVCVYIYMCVCVYIYVYIYIHIYIFSKFVVTPYLNYRRNRYSLIHLFNNYFWSTRLLDLDAAAGEHLRTGYGHGTCPCEACALSGSLIFNRGNSFICFL